MNSFDLLEAMSNLPDETIKVKNKCFKKFLLPISAAVMLVLCVSAFGVYYSRSNKMVGPPAVCGPISSFGLCPSNRQNAQLISENVVATKNSDNQYTYDVNMEYKVKTDKDLEFSIPFALPPTSSFSGELNPMEICIDGKPVKYSKEYIPNVLSTRPMGTTDKLKQSIEIYPLQVDLGYQPKNTYDLVTNGYGKKLNLFNEDSKFSVYEISQKAKKVELEIIGNINQFRFVFKSNGIRFDRFCNYEMEFIDKENNIGMTKYIQSGNESLERFFVLGFPVNSSNLSVKLNGKVVNPTVMKMKDIILKYDITDNSSEYIDKLNLYTGPIIPIGKVFHVDKWTLNKVVVTGDENGSVEKYRFNVPSGDHVITVKQQNLGDSNSNSYHLFQLIDSPNSFWKSTGERKFTVDVKGNKTTYSIGNDIIDFVKSNYEESTTSNTNNWYDIFLDLFKGKKS